MSTHMLMKTRVLIFVYIQERASTCPSHDLPTSNKTRMALEVLRSMAEMLVEANTWSYNSSITACESASHWEVALLQLHQMRAAELEPHLQKFEGGENEKISLCRYTCMAKKQVKREVKSWLGSNFGSG